MREAIRDDEVDQQRPSEAISDNQRRFGIGVTDQHSALVRAVVVPRIGNTSLGTTTT